MGDALGKTTNGVYDALELEAVQAKPSSSLLSLFKFSSRDPLSQKTLEPAMLKMKEHLIQKNVASDTASRICESVSERLIGKRLGTLESMESVIKTEMHTVLSKILTPNASTDILRDIMAAKQKKRPFTITFVGVNGVGKSTNLSKICFWLLQNKLKVLIAACDTFRSGAVEQLRVHARNLMALEQGAVVDLFDRGYGKDPAGIAKEAIYYGKMDSTSSNSWT